ncbi:ribosome recycling factor [Candidatus Saccharibacteria bacterium 32-45-3]|nr:MAG: ribosome recycling factor [Candidatus Saccharibacteria bacterium 32-45-3]
MFNAKPYEDRFISAVSHFEEELKKVRTGRAHPSMLESVHVETYGQLMPLNQVSNVLAPEPQMLTVTPFDPSNLQAIATAIRNDQSLGLNPSDDGRIIRVPIPPLTEDRRKQIVKQTSEKVEETRISLRNIRQDAIKEAKRMKDAKEISEDDQKRAEKSIDDLIASYNVKIDDIFKAKEKEILKI